MKAINRYMKQLRKSLKKGFTLIELAIVGLFLGLLAVFAISQFSGAATDNTRAVSLFEAATKVSDNWALLSQQCGVSRDITTTPLATGGTAANAAATNLSLLLGNASVATAYQGCYDTAGVRPLTGLASGAAGSESVSGYAMTVSLAATGNDRYVAVNYAKVPSSVFNAAAAKYAGLSTPPASTATVAVAPNVSFAYSAAAADGTRTVSFVRPL